VLNATFNNISVISWRSVLLVEETAVPGDVEISGLSSRYLFIRWTFLFGIFSVIIIKTKVLLSQA
jgi:hypothetical protein